MRLPGYEIKTTDANYERFFGLNTGGVSNTSAAYTYVPLIFRCVRMICDSLSTVELKCYRGKGDAKKEIDWPWPETDQAEFTWNNCAGLLLSGFSCDVILSNTFGAKRGLQWLNPTSISVDVMQYGEADYGPRFTQSGNAYGGNTRTWGRDEVIYIREFNPDDDILPGPSAAGVALTDAGLIRYLTKFASYYFEHGAMPLTILSVDKAVSDNEIKRVQGLLTSVMSGVNKAWRILAMRFGKDTAPFTITPPLKDLVMVDLYDQARRAVAGAFSIPQTMLEDAANYATAVQHDQQFWEGTIVPRGKMIAGAMNRHPMIRKMGVTFEYDFEELQAFQTDEAERAGSLKTMTDAGIPLLMAMDMLGYDLDDEDRAILEAELLRKQEAAQRLADNLNKPKEPVSPQLQQGQPPAQDQQQPPATDATATRSALFNWKRAALQAVKTGHSANVDFDHPAIDAEVCEFIRYELEAAKTAADVHGIFKRAREMGGQSIEIVMTRALDWLDAHEVQTTGG